MDQKPDYGIDAPNVIRNLSIVSVISLILAFVMPDINFSNVHVIFFQMWISLFISCGLMALLMIMYSKYGKLVQRDKMLAMIEWKGNEKVLDVGTGKSLLMIGAAKKLSAGKSYGIDIWRKSDISSNAINSTMKNAEEENVLKKIEILEEDARNMSFESDFFDVILSNVCLHNIDTKEDRRKACGDRPCSKTRRNRSDSGFYPHLILQKSF